MKRLSFVSRSSPHSHWKGGSDLRRGGALRSAEDTGIEWHDIAPGKPIQNAVKESFDGRLRDECRGEHAFFSLAEARGIIEAWRIDDNTVCPHSSLGGLAPSTFATRSQRDQNAAWPNL